MPYQVHINIIYNIIQPLKIYLILRETSYLATSSLLIKCVWPSLVSIIVRSSCIAALLVLSIRLLNLFFKYIIDITT